METQNINITLPKHLLLQLELIAVQRQTSVSNLVTWALMQIVEQAEVFERAKQRHQYLLQQGLDLGTKGSMQIKRGEPYEHRD